MSSFTLLHKSVSAPKDRFYSINKEKGLRKGYSGAIGDYNIHFYNKAFVEEDCFLVRDGAGVFVAGTLIYKRTADMAASLDLLLKDLASGKFSYKNVRGHFAFVFTPDFKSLYLGIDQVAVQNIFFDKAYKYIGSSFTSLVAAYDGRLTHNKWAITENVVHGKLIGPDTIYNEVNRYEMHLGSSLGSISMITNGENRRDFDSLNSYSKEVDAQLGHIDRYFEDVKGFAERYGSDLGLSDGHDSRLLASFTKKHLKNIRYYTFWRKKKNKEIEIAENVCRALDEPLWIEECVFPLDKSEAELEDNYRNAFLFFDGLPRLHCYFNEEQNTIKFREKTRKEIKLGLNGIGGEQYRNDEHLLLPTYDKRAFVRNNLTYFITGKCIADGAEGEFMDYVTNKLDNIIFHGRVAGKRYTRKDLRIYYSEVYINSIRTNRNNAEGQFSFFVSPFIDAQLLLEAYKVYPHMGVSYSFQQEMIRRADAKLANVISGYGYTFTKGEPFKDKIKYVVKTFVPARVLINRAHKMSKDKGADSYLGKYSFLRDALGEIKKLSLPIDLDLLMRNRDRWPTILSLGYTIKQFNELREKQ